MRAYKAPNAELLLFTAEDILKESDEFQLKIDWFSAPQEESGSDQTP